MADDKGAGLESLLGGNDIFRSIVEEVDDGVYVLDTERRIVFWNKGASRITGFEAGDVVGKLCRDEILVHLADDASPLCLSGCPAQQAMTEGTNCQADLFLRHRQGHRVPVRARVAPLSSAGGEVVGAMQVFTDMSAARVARQRIEDLERQSLLDELTGLGNRRNGEAMLARHLAEFERYGWQFGLLYFDVDRFKKVNDEHGHAAGDTVLRMLSRTTQNALRSADTVSRWGGEEFIAVVLNVGPGELGRVAEELRALVARSTTVQDGQAITVTVSVGGTVVREGDTADTILERADALMYESKTAGGNSVTVA